MERLIKELQELQSKEHVSPNQIVGAVLAAAVRFRQVVEARAVGTQALAAAIAMQPAIDVSRLHADFLAIVESHYPSPADVPLELRDIAAAIELAATDRR